MSAAYELRGALPALDRPVLLVALHGWIDAAGAAGAAMNVLQQQCSGETLAVWDSDAFIDYRARRPVMELRDGVNTRLAWQDIELKVGTDVAGLPVLTLSGPEPDSQWKRFASSVAELALRLGVCQMVALGAYPFGCPHTRPPRLSSSSPSADVIANTPYLKSSVDVPAGVSAVLEHALTEAGIPSLGMWVQVPHYVSAMSYPEASLALLAGVREVTGISVRVDDLAADAALQRARIDRLVEANDDHATMVRGLEVAYDTLADQTLSLGSADLPTGDDLAAEFEQFLRDQPE